MPTRKPAILNDLDQPTRRLALAQLLEAHEAAEEGGQYLWSYACQLPSLQAQGITDTALRWLIERALAEHRLETTRRGAAHRTFRRCQSTCFTAASTFILTAKGVLAARQSLTRSGSVASRLDRAAQNHRPHFDRSRRALLVGSTLVKQFRVPARNQELILAAFEEEGWPSHLDDPLPPIREMDPAKRLLDAIYRLNRRQRPRLMVFEGDGNGKGIRWRRIDVGSTVD